MKKMWRPSGPARQLPSHDYDLEGARAFQDWAAHLAQWQWQRADAFERKAGVLLGAVAVVFTLSPGLAGAVAGLGGPWLVVAATLAGMAFAAFLVAAYFGTMTLAAQRSAHASIEQVRAEWTLFKEHREPRRHPQAIRGQFADQLLGAGREDAPVVLLKRDADKRASRFQVAAWAFLTAVVLTALSGATIVIEGAVT